MLFRCLIPQINEFETSLVIILLNILLSVLVDSIIMSCAPEKFDNYCLIREGNKRPRFPSFHCFRGALAHAERFLSLGSR